MFRSRPMLTLLVTAVLGAAVGLTLARISDDNPAPAGGPVITLGQTASVESPAGRLTLAYPDGWFGGQARVNCDTAPEVHASTDDIVMQSLRLSLRAEATCIPELDPRPLTEDGAYVSAAFLRLADIGCGTSIPTTPPGGLSDLKLDVPSEDSLREFDAADAYDGLEWRHGTWCVPGGYSVRVEVFIGKSAPADVRDRIAVVIEALEFTPAQPTP